jgi:hypothetical protein
MNAERWAYVALALLIWAAIVVMWSSGPHDCTPPDQRGNVHCKG